MITGDKGMLTRGAVQACLVLHCAHAFVLAPVGNLQDPVGKRLSIAQGKVTAHEPLPHAVLQQGGRVAHIHGRTVQLKMLIDPSLAQNPQLALLFPSFLLPFYLLSCPLTWYLLLQFGFVFGLKAMASTADYVDRKVRTGRPCTLCSRRLSGPYLIAAEFMYPVACPVQGIGTWLRLFPEPRFPHTPLRALSRTHPWRAHVPASTSL